MDKKKKIEWLAVLQGFSMLLVVIGHVSLTNVPGDPSTPIATGIESVVYSFHMPLFIFISGWLFYYTCIRKRKGYSEVVKAKLKRLGIPFLAFTLIAIALKAAFPSLMHRPVTGQELIDTFLLFRSNPLGEMWFVVVLLVLMLLYPLYCYALRQRWAVCMLVIGCMVMFILPPPPVNIFYIGKVCHMAPFFVGGILCCKYEWQRYLEGYVALIVTTVMFVLWNVLDVMPDPMKFVSISTGIVFSFSLCLNLAKRWSGLFSSFRDYTFQIFLMGIFFQMAIRWAFVKWGSDVLFVPMWLMSVVIGVYVPTKTASVIEKHAPKGVRMCFGL
jgi:fucose 4-O-acetylase-like acetyltransferase